MATTPRLLIIAGSDSSGGAGIQADIKTASALGVYAMTAVTAVTVQDTKRVHAVHLVPPEIVREQIRWCLADIGADAIKIGMLGSAAVAEAVADTLENARGIPIVLDPVLASGNGAPLLDAAGMETMKQRLFLLAALVTPNLPETEALVRLYPKTDDDFRGAAECFASLGADRVLFKDGHGGGNNVRDVLADSSTGALTFFESPRQDTQHTHGTGCTLATAIACGLAHGMTLTDAVRSAHNYVQAAIRSAPGLGQGHGPINHLR